MMLRLTVLLTLAATAKGKNCSEHNGATDASAGSDPTSLASAGLTCGTMCIKGELNVSWSQSLHALYAMGCVSAKNDEKKCLYEDDGKKKKDPPMCTFSKSEGCAYDKAEGDCMVNTLNIMCGCPGMAESNFQPSAKTCGKGTTCGKAITSTSTDCEERMDKEKDGSGGAIVQMKKVCGLPPPAPPPGPPSTSGVDRMCLSLAAASTVGMAFLL